jgi:hypothetical protein
MSPRIKTQAGKPPGMLFICLVLIAMLVLYPLAGAALTLLATGGRLVGLDSGNLDVAMLPRLRAAQAIGQVLALALPAILLAGRHSGSRTPFSAGNFAWLGISWPVRLLQLLMASAGMLLLQPLMYSIVEVQNLLLPFFGEAGKAMLRNQQRLDQFIRWIASSDSLPGFMEVAAVLALTPALCEELFFRGYVQKSFSSILSPLRAVLLTGFVFALFHMEPSNLLPLTLLGWYIGYIYLKSGNLAVPAVAHGTNNLAALLFLQGDRLISGIPLLSGGQGIVSMWQWWVFVLVSLVLFFVLLPRFTEPTASA